MVPLLLLSAALLVAIAIAFGRGGTALVGEGLGGGLGTLGSVAPQLLVGFLLAGMLTVLLPTDLIATWLGDESGLRGVVIATVAGAITPGGPFLQFPLVASLANAGAGYGALAAYLTAWSLLGVNRLLVWEIPLLGTHFSIARWAVSLIAPVVVGYGVAIVMRLARA